MEFGGTDVDIETGSPVAPIRKAREEKRAERIISEYQSLVNDLSGNGGEVLKKIAGLYADRINELIKTDPACRSFQMIFDDIKIKINIGKTMTKIKLNEIEASKKQSL
jgi:hypothetical protein